MASVCIFGFVWIFAEVCAMVDYRYSVDEVSKSSLQRASDILNGFSEVYEYFRERLYVKIKKKKIRITFLTLFPFTGKARH